LIRAGFTLSFLLLLLNMQWANAFSSVYAAGMGIQSSALSQPVPGDFDADGKTDPAVYDPGLSAYCAWLSGSGYAPAILIW